VADNVTLVIRLTDGFGEQKYTYTSKKIAIRRYNLVCDMLKHGAYKEKNIKISYAYIVLPDGRKQRLK